jgi:hypothetical protein
MPSAFSSPIKHSFYQISFYLKIFVLINAINWKALDDLYLDTGYNLTFQQM